MKTLISSLLSIIPVLKTQRGLKSGNSSKHFPVRTKEIKPRLWPEKKSATKEEVVPLTAPLSRRRFGPPSISEEKRFRATKKIQETFPTRSRHAVHDY